ncbi:hypothetical protein DM01DRAFT_1300034 [Hesseltinella vesiculosa]|uniref:DNA polymerase epsilon catalytic subunit n=1 Tax=Hesseltinella vesiculosa TaxID=101127 RepID=A0A1X2GTF1_9FUNG|nr:hypothetical protein DM01DRAFT_1300034 [Hesseltinella vesiculosa]
MSQRAEFGVSSSRFNKFGNRGGGAARPGSTHANKYGLPTRTSDAPTNLDQRFEDIRILDEIDTRFGFDRYEEGPERLGWLMNMHATLIMDDEWTGGYAAVNYYFLAENGETFKATIKYSPYFYIGCKRGTEAEVEDYLRRRFENVIEKMSREEREDLDQPNHLLGNTRLLIKLTFRNVSDLLSVRKVLLPVAKKNQQKLDAIDTYTEVVNETNHIAYDQDHQSAAMSSRKNPQETLENIIDIREYDVPYYVRVAIDLDIRVGLWYNVKALDSGTTTFTRRTDMVHRPDPVILAFDIETTKLPLKFPDATIDSIMMISYMIEGRGYLITNREIVSQDIDDFEYTPKPEFEGPFTIFNEPDERSLLHRFFEHIQEARPTIFVTYNGDFFDWPFVEARAKFHGIDMYREIGVYKDDEDEYKCKHATHMDAFRWVKRDSYLPQGSQGLKAVTTAKLGYNPMELDPEDMTRFASEQPQTLAQYSVSDAVATFYLYMKYVHPFIFSLCNILPLIPDEVLRKGTGTLCELLLMVEAYKVNVIIPNKHVEDNDQFYEGHKVENQTYVGGHVEALEAGVFRSDISTDFKLDPTGAQQLIDQLDDALKFTIRVEENKKLEDIANYDEVYNAIKAQLEDLRDNPTRKETPLIYHLDVAAMYPNIILTNRLQPDAMIDESTCATCEFNLPGKECDRRMTWMWRGEYSPAKRNEYRMIVHQLSIETFPPKIPNGARRPWQALAEAEQQALISKRLSEYSKKVYKKLRETKVEERESIICQRENPFYIETVRAFRDRRYEYKGLHKTWKQNLDAANKEGSLTKATDAKNMIVLYDSLQLAHKCILNSFYGYVMRKGARWHSLEMAGIVCLTGSRIIQMARQLVERIGRPLELDTDGIWCILPKSFPESFKFTMTNGKSFKIDYPCTMLNHLVHAGFTNHQYQDLVDRGNMVYATHSENSIFFEIDGPYRAMILPASTQEDKLLKKRYAVFNDDGSLAELKGFEVKRRGELKLIKIFQSDLFKVFLDGLSLEECYDAVAKVANQWLDILYSKGVELQDEELFELISENRSMSRTLEEYGSQKSTSISTAKRLAEFLGDQMVKDKGLACQFVISARPYDLPVSERAIPVAIFSAEPSVKKHYLRKWLKDDSLTAFDIRNILDWAYYLERFGSVIQKLITIPAAMQKVRNPVPRVAHPDWLFKRIAARDDKFRQHRITDMFSKAPRPTSTSAMDVDGEEPRQQDPNHMDTGDIEDLNIGGNGRAPSGLPKTARVTKRKRLGKSSQLDLDDDDEDDEALNEPPPDMQDDYLDWLVYQKKKWKRQRRQRALLRETMGNLTNLPAQRAGAGVGEINHFFQRQTGSLLTVPWQVIQIVDADGPGQFRMWVSMQNQLHCIRLTVPRTFYVNSFNETPPVLLESDPDACEIVKCVRTLPRSHPCYHLFRLSMEENIYQNECKTFASLFNDPSTEGVYETQVPLSVRAILQLGSVCQVDRSAADPRVRLEDTFRLDWLKPRADLQPKYLDSPENMFNYVYLHHVMAGPRHFYALVGACLPESHLFFVNASRDNLPNFSRVYSDRYEQLVPGVTSKLVEYKPSMTFKTTHETSEPKLLRSLSRVLQDLNNTKPGPVMLCIVSPRPVQFFSQHLSSALPSFPYLMVPCMSNDNRLDSLNWTHSAFKRMVSRYMQLNNFLESRIQQARYANAPLCNIPNDPQVFIADLSFARQLLTNDMVLWWSASGRPDLGGREDDEHMANINDLVNSEINNPGSYETISVEIDVLRLCLNTILMAPVINELEGTVATVGFDDATTHTALGVVSDDTKEEDKKNPAKDLDGDVNMTPVNGALKQVALLGDAAISHKTFSVLRNLVQQWFQQALTKENPISELLLDSLFRWLLSPSSNMYDGCMYSLVHSLMKKVFMQLVAEVKRLGAKVIYASFHRLVIGTTKETMEGAIPYWQYLCRSIQRKQVLEVLELNLINYWDVTVWMDEMNYGGIVGRVPASMDPAAPLAVTSSETAPGFIKMKWNICDYLAPVTQGKFTEVVAKFIRELYDVKKQCPRDIKYQMRHQKQQQQQDALLHQGAPLMDQPFADLDADDDNTMASVLSKKKKGKAPASDNANDDEVDERVHKKRDFVQLQVKGNLLEYLPSLIKEQEHYHGQPDRVDMQFPRLPGSHLTMTNPALEMIKAITAVLALDPCLERQARLLKRNALGMITHGSVSEFSDEAQFQNPCDSLKLSQVVCTGCGHTEDLDISRDRHLIQPSIDGVTAGSGSSSYSIWRCRACKAYYDKTLIESTMTTQVNRWLVAYQLQELVCQRCRWIKQENLLKQCDKCGGEYRATQSKQDLLNKLSIFKNIAEQQHLNLLLEIVSWTMARCQA